MYVDVNFYCLVQITLTLVDKYIALSRTAYTVTPKITYFGLVYFSFPSKHERARYNCENSLPR